MRKLPAILKIIFDRVPELKPWGKLFGDEVPTMHKGEVWNLNRSRRATYDRSQKMLLQVGPATKEKASLY